MSGHKLNNRFRLFFHDPLSYNWTIQSYITITDISTIEKYWETITLLNEYLHLGMFFLMRENISPLWNETDNNYSFSIKVARVSDTCKLPRFNLLVIFIPNMSIIQKINIIF